MRSHTHKRRIPHGFLIDLTNPGAIAEMDSSKSAHLKFTGSRT